MAGVDESRVGERVKGVVIGLHWGGTCTRVVAVGLVVEVGGVGLRMGLRWCVGLWGCRSGFG